MSIEQIAVRLRAVTASVAAAMTHLSAAEDDLEKAHHAMAAHTAGTTGSEPAEILNDYQLARDGLRQALRRCLAVSKTVESFAAGLTGRAAGDPAPRSKHPQRALPAPISPEWGPATQAALPEWNGGATVGTFVDQDGISHSTRSGAEDDGTDKELATFMRERGLVPPAMQRPEASKHVELKLAYRMRRSDTDRVEVAINKAVDTARYGCHRLLPFVLKPGQTLIVHDPSGTKTYLGRESP